MLRIVFGNHLPMVDWACGTFKSFPVSYEDVQHVTIVKASGSERDLIERLIDSISIPRFIPDGGPVRWFGDDAKFIVGCLVEINKDKPLKLVK